VDILLICEVSGLDFFYWDKLMANAAKTWLIVNLSTAETVFVGCGVNVTIEGKCHLGAGIGSIDHLSCSTHMAR